MVLICLLIFYFYFETIQETEDGILSVQVLEFKTTLLDAVQELYIRRVGKLNYLINPERNLDWICLSVFDTDTV